MLVDASGVVVRGGVAACGVVGMLLAKTAVEVAAAPAAPPATGVAVAGMPAATTGVGAVMTVATAEGKTIGVVPCAEAGGQLLGETMEGAAARWTVVGCTPFMLGTINGGGLRLTKTGAHGRLLIKLAVLVVANDSANCRCCICCICSGGCS